MGSIIKMEQQQREIDMLKLQVKRIDAKSRMTEVMKQRSIKWAEENPDKADALEMAKISTDAINLDDFLEHYITKNHGELEEFLDSIPKQKYLLSMTSKI